MKNKELRIFKEYCSGCGLCASAAGVKFDYDRKGFLVPNLNENHYSFCSKYCHVSNSSLPGDSGGIWGSYSKAYYCYSNDSQIRNQSSSGGAISSICIYLIENKVVDYIIQTTADPDNPIRTSTVLSNSREQIMKCSGSRYASSSPLMNILNVIDYEKKYAFVGKPCDVRSLWLYIKDNDELRRVIPCLIAFFCAGVPSETAETKLLNRLGCSNVKNADDLTYRGNGWPGETILKQKDKTTSIKYEEAWGDILGRDVRRSCRFCLDGVGKCADLAFGDGWYLDGKGFPIFDNIIGGRNCCLVRNEYGEELLSQAVSQGYLTCEIINRPDDVLRNTQPYQYERSASMKSMLLALSLLGKPRPKYNRELLVKLSKLIPFKIKCRRFLGTIKRNVKSKR